MNKEKLTDVSGLVFENNIPREQRAAWIADKVGNPCCFRVGETKVKLEFPDEGPSLQEVLTSFMIRKKSGL